MKKFLITSTIVLTLVVSVVAAFSLTGRAYAQSATPTATADSQSVTPSEGGRGGHRDGGQLREYMLAAEAEAFGLTPEALQTLYDEGKSLTDLAIEQNLTVAEFEAKVDAAHQSAIEQAMTDGVLTQAQADAYAERKAQNAGNPRHQDTDNPLYTYMLEAKAEAFGITPEALEALYAEGKGLKDLAIEQNLSMADFQAKREAAHQAALTNAVADGVITQEQADAMQERIEMGRGEGMGHHGRGHGKGSNGACPTTPDDATDDTTTLPES